MNRSAWLLTLLIVATPTLAEGELLSEDIESLLQHTLDAQRGKETEPAAESEVSPARERTQKVKQQASSENTEQETKPKPVNLSEPNLEGNVNAYNLKVNQLRKLLSQTDSPKLLLEQLIAEGTLALSPNDIGLLRVTVDELERAKNAPFVSPDIINKEYMVNHLDRYQTYELFLHDTGETLLEFLDINGDPWPVWDHSDLKDYDVRLGEDHMLWMSPRVKYKPTNFFVTLEGYRNPIQFVVKYSNDKRHGLATFKLPYVSPTSEQKVTSNSKVNTPSLANLSLSLTGEGGEKPKLTMESLSYLAATGRFPSDSDAQRTAVRVLVSDPDLASIWMVDGLFVVRTPYYLNTFDEVVNASGDMRVFIASELNSIVTINTGNGLANLYIPNYHQLVK